MSPQNAAPFDLRPAPRHELGLRGIWVNRRGETGNPDWLPYAEVADLNGAAALLLPTGE